VRDDEGRMGTRFGASLHLVRSRAPHVAPLSIPLETTVQGVLPTLLPPALRRVVGAALHETC